MATRASNPTLVFQVDITALEKAVAKVRMTTDLSITETQKGILQATQAIKAGLKDLASFHPNYNFRDANTKIRELIAQKRELERAKLNFDIKEAKKKIESLKDSVATTIAVAQNMTKPITMAIDYEDAFADVKKVANFADTAQEKEFSDQLKALATKVAIAPTELTKIAAAGGQMGIPIKDLIKFTELTAKGAVAFDMSCEEIGNSFGKMMASLNLPMEQLGALGDAINLLSNNYAAKSNEIVKAMMNKGASGGQAQGFKPQETAAFVTAMIESGAAAEVAGNGFQSMAKSLGNVSNMNGKKLDVMKKLGFTDMEKYKKDWKNNPAEMALEVLKRLQKSADKSALASTLFGNEFDSRILAMNVEHLAKMFEQLKDPVKVAANSMESEFQSRLATTKNGIKQMITALQTFAINIGDYFLPAINKIADGLRDFIEKITAFIKQNREAVGVVARVVAVFAAFKVAIVAAKLALAVLNLAFLSGIKNLAIFGASVAAQTARLILFAVAGIRGAVTSLITFIATGGTATMALTAIGGALTGVGVAITGVMTKFLLFSKAFLLSPIGLAVSALVIAFAAIYANIDKIGEKFPRVAKVITTAVNIVKSVIDGVISAISWIFDKAGTAISWITGGDAVDSEEMAQQRKAAQKVVIGGNELDIADNLRKMQEYKPQSPFNVAGNLIGTPSTTSNSQTINDYGVVNVNVQTGANAQEIGAAVSKARQNNWSFQ